MSVELRIIIFLIMLLMMRISRWLLQFLFAVNLVCNLACTCCMRYIHNPETNESTRTKKRRQSSSQQHHHYQWAQQHSAQPPVGKSTKKEASDREGLNPFWQPSGADKANGGNGRSIEWDNDNDDNGDEINHTVELSTSSTARECKERGEWRQSAKPTAPSLEMA